MKKRAFSLVELMVVVAIIAILASIALPMYNKFRRNANAKSVLSPVNTMKEALVAYYLGNEKREGNFTDLGYNQTNGAIFEAATSSNIGIGLPPMHQVTWTVSFPTSNRVNVSWVIASCATCNGAWCLECLRESGVCQIAVHYSDNTFSKYNYNYGGITCP